MLNEREDKDDGDDTEYHFSDEEINYDADSSDESKPAAAAPSGTSSFSGVLQKKRMIISIVVFIVLVSVVYKMVTPTVQTAPDVNFADIKPAPAAIPTPKMAAQQTPPPIPSPQQIAPMPPNSPAALRAQQPTQSELEQAYNTSTTVPAAPQTAAPSETQMPAAPAVQPVTTMPAQPAPMGQPSVAGAQPVQPQAPLPIEPGPAMPTQAAPVAPVAGSTETINVPGSEAIDNKVVTLAAQNQKLMERLQEQYDQRIKDYQSQNQNLQQQVQTLNSRVAGMENQLTQVVKGLSKEQPKEAAPELQQRSDAYPAEAVPSRIPYNVQAIIPGRAWLKSENGETITVAEGDTIKGIGRVTRIDPYDGVVEVNTGRKNVTLSYGNGA